MRLGGVAVEQILSGTLGSPQDYDQAHDEWVVVLEGGAVLEVEGERLDLAAGDWVLLRAHVPHRLVETVAGTSWLAIHATPPANEPATRGRPSSSGVRPGPGIVTSRSDRRWSGS